MWFLFGEVSFSSGCLGWATLLYCGAFHIIITKSQNTKRTYGQPSEQLFLKWWSISNLNGTKIIQKIINKFMSMLQTKIMKRFIRLDFVNNT